MLSDKHIRILVDYDNFKEVFPGVDLAGGACFFLWDRDHLGPCKVTNVSGDSRDTAIRDLDEYDTFIRSNKALAIVNKVNSLSYDRHLNEVVYSRIPFGIPTTYTPYKVVWDRTEPMKMIGFILPNEGSSEPLQSFAVSVDEVEQKTGLDFFSMLPKEQQEALESSITIDAWKWQ